jgi:bifunctional UDP-N-acetylglucosamine pyrophosphorylase/glucosamine-1-phosphate N-acetyltransferase
MARLRPGTRLHDGVRVGNFVEIKAAILHDHVAANHLSYLGDAEVGAATNIGAGTITCNYDGHAKHRTVIGEGVFVGSGTELVAPVSLGDSSTIAAGSTVTHDVPAESLCVARTRQRLIPGWARRLTRRKG